MPLERARRKQVSVVVTMGPFGPVLQPFAIKVCHHERKQRAKRSVVVIMGPFDTALRPVALPSAQFYIDIDSVICRVFS